MFSIDLNFLQEKEEKIQDFYILFWLKNQFDLLRILC